MGGGLSGTWDMWTTLNVWIMFNLGFVRSCKGDCGARDVGDLFRGYLEPHLVELDMFPFTCVSAKYRRNSFPGGFRKRLTENRFLGLAESLEPRQDRKVWRSSHLLVLGCDYSKQVVYR